MKNNLKNNITALYYLEDCKIINGKNEYMTGDCTGLKGHFSWLRGDCTGLKGDLNSCEINEEERKQCVNIKDLILEDKQ